MHGRTIIWQLSAANHSILSVWSHSEMIISFVFFLFQSLGYIIGACLPKFKYSITAANTIMVVYLLLGECCIPLTRNWGYLPSKQMIYEWYATKKVRLTHPFRMKLYISGGFFNTHFPSWFTWAKYVSFLFYPFAAILTLLFGDIEPFRYFK